MFFKPKRVPGSLGKLNRPSPHRQDRKVIEIQDGLEVHVFWKQVDDGSGPSCSVFVLEHELMKFDCYGEQNGHYHIALPSRSGSTRNILRFDVQTIEQQIDRAVFELANNLIYYCERAVHPAMRTFKIDQSAIADAAPGIKADMLEALAVYQRTTDSPA